MSDIINFMSIKVENLIKNYSVYKKEPGISGSFRSLFSRKNEIVKAVEGISFDIAEGELIGFIGPNGAGKTTTLKILSGLLHPTSGSVNVLGYTPQERKKEFLKKIGLIMGQKNQLWWDLPAVDSFLLQKEIYEIPDSTYKRTLTDLLDLLDAHDIYKVAVKKLSLGQRMKMEIIATLLHNPKVLFLDEPTIGLDVVMQKSLRDFTKEYNKKYNSTVLLTSHYMKDVEELCKRVIIVNHGKILYDGLLENLVKKYSPFKSIVITFNEDIDPKKLEELGELEKYENQKAEILVKRDKSNEILSKILSKFDVDDINIEEPEIEEVIRKVFGDK